MIENVHIMYEINYLVFKNCVGIDKNGPNSNSLLFLH